MPTYVYYCEKCAIEFEKFHSISAHAETRCSICGGPVRQVFGATAGFLINSKSKSKPVGDTCCSHGEQCEHPKRCCEH
jgi:putative FmdB family regulatory protein